MFPTNRQRRAVANQQRSISALSFAPVGDVSDGTALEKLAQRVAILEAQIANAATTRTHSLRRRSSNAERPVGAAHVGAGASPMAGSLKAKTRMRGGRVLNVFKPSGPEGRISILGSAAERLTARAGRLRRGAWSAAHARKSRVGQTGENPKWHELNSPYKSAIRRTV